MDRRLYDYPDWYLAACVSEEPPVGVGEDQLSPATMVGEVLPPPGLWHPWLYNWTIPPLSDIPPQAQSEELHTNSPEDEGNPVIKAESSSPDTLAAPESPRSPYLYDIPPFRRSQSPSPLNLVEAAVDSVESEATIAEKPEPSSPETDDDVVELPRSPGSPSLNDIPRFYAAPDLSPPQPAPEDFERPIPSRARLVTPKCSVAVECKRSDSGSDSIGVM